MNEIIDKAIAHITDEAMKLNEQLTTMIEEHLTNICTNEVIAEKLLNKNKSLKELNDNIWNKARSQKKGNGAYIPDSEIYNMAEKYYEIKEEDKTTGKRIHLSIPKNSEDKATKDKKINVLDFI